MKNRFDALNNQKKSDREFLTKIIAQICDYAADNDMEPSDTITTIAANMLMLAKIVDYRRKANDKGNN